MVVVISRTDELKTTCVDRRLEWIVVVTGEIVPWRGNPTRHQHRAGVESGLEHYKVFRENGVGRQDIILSGVNLQHKEVRPTSTMASRQSPTRPQDRDIQSQPRSLTEASLQDGQD